ncbi:hypothetical protein SEUCBS140593_004591 [Sporothrix eucalyptigena]|uniref:AB hydrolase-1 domain-containing protein n=1 Tax=Sporothrix eucalyptigena TaxID=1812306 RepID=A0ABP0BP79_9PEZI
MSAESSIAEILTNAPEDIETAKRLVSKADLVSATVYRKGEYNINEIQYAVFIKHDDSNPKILITVRVVMPHDDKRDLTSKDVVLDKKKPIAVYLVGGPGSDNPPTSHKALNDFYLGKGFQILYMDYRGTGSSNLLMGDNVADKPILEGLDSSGQAKMLSLFRQDNIVRDLEAVRTSLVKDSKITSAKKWTLIGQSYGGWVSFTYLSFYPQALNMVIVTGGIPPVGQSAETVYKHTYKTVINACDTFYNKYKHHEDSVRIILEFIGNQRTKNGQMGIDMESGGILTPERFLCLGRTLGTSDGDEKVNEDLNKCIKNIKEKGNLDDSLKEIERWLRFEERPLYAILQESIYTEPGLPAAWAAEKVGRTLDEYWWLEDGAFNKVFNPAESEDELFRKEHFDGKRIYMSAEHVYRFHFEQYKALRPLKGAAEILANKTDWPPLFDTEQLSKNTVPISSLCYDRDMFIDWTLSQNTVKKIPAETIVSAHSNDLMHTAVKDKPDLVLGLVWNGLIGAVEATARVEAATRVGPQPKAEDLIDLLQ